MGQTSAPAQPPTMERLAPDLSRGPGGVAEKFAFYWVGTRFGRVADPETGATARPTPPCVNFNIGGVTFPSWFTPWDDATQSRGKFPGAIVRLTTSQVGYLKAILKRTIVRWRERAGQHAHGYPLTLHDEDSLKDAVALLNLSPAQAQLFRAKQPTAAKTFPTDEPAAKYLYCVRVDAAGVREGSTYRPAAELPESVLVTGIEAP